jgi:hypothetical protein
MAAEIQPVRIFIAYAHDDASSRERLRVHLNVLQRRGLCHIFWDGLILPGERWDERLKTELHSADIFLLLVSEHFLDSDYVHEVELPKALELHKQGKAEVLPVILRHCPWKYTELADFQCVLYEGRPIEVSNGFAHVAELVAETALRLKTKRSDGVPALQAKPEKETKEKNRLAEEKAAKVLADRERQLREQADQDLWEFAEETDTEASYRRYLNKYPKGLHAAAAQAKINILTAPLARKIIAYYKGKEFRKGDYVSIVKWAGTFKPENTGHINEITADFGKKGKVLSLISTNVVLVEWEKQEFVDYKTGKNVLINTFVDSIHLDYLEVIR